MTLKSSGSLSTKEINQYLSRNSQDSFSMDTGISRELARRPGNQKQIAYSDYRGKSIIPTYQLTVDKATVAINQSQFESFTVTLTTTNLPDGTVVPYNITGVLSSDIAGADLIGQFVVKNNKSAVTFFAAPPAVTAPKARITADKSRVVPGEVITFTVTSSNINGSKLDWKNIGTSQNTNVLSEISQGIVNLDASGGGTFSLRINPQYDFSNNGKTVLISLLNNGTVLSTTGPIIVSVPEPIKPRMLTAVWNPLRLDALEKTAVLSWSAANAEYVDINVEGAVPSLIQRQPAVGTALFRFDHSRDYAAMLIAVRGADTDIIKADIQVRDLTPKFDAPGEQYYYIPGTYRFTVPNYANQLEIACIGGGGGGGSQAGTGETGQQSYVANGPIFRSEGYLLRTLGGEGGGFGRYYGTLSGSPKPLGTSALVGQKKYGHPGGTSTNAGHGVVTDSLPGIFDQTNGSVIDSKLGLKFLIKTGKGGHSGPTVDIKHWHYAGGGAGGAGAFSTFNVGELIPGTVLDIQVGKGGLVGGAIATVSVSPGNQSPSVVRIAVAEKNSIATAGSWNHYQSIKSPGDKFYLLQPKISANPQELLIPTAFKNDANAFGPIPVNSDSGQRNRASDWFAICNLESVPTNTQIILSRSGPIELFPFISASLDLLRERCFRAGLQLIEFEEQAYTLNWIQSFLGSGLSVKARSTIIGSGDPAIFDIIIEAPAGVKNPKKSITWNIIEIFNQSFDESSSEGDPRMFNGQIRGTSILDENFRTTVLIPTNKNFATSGRQFILNVFYETGVSEEGDVLGISKTSDIITVLFSAQPTVIPALSDPNARFLLPLNGSTHGFHGAVGIKWR